MVDGQQIQFHQVVHPLSLEEQQQLHDQGVTQPVIQIQEQLSGESMPQGLQVHQLLPVHRTQCYFFPQFFKQIYNVNIIIKSNPEATIYMHT